jgi:serine/threonine protein kinase
MRIPKALWRRLMPLLDEALALPPAERTAWLATQAKVLDADCHAALARLVADREALDQGSFMAALPALALPELAPGSAGSHAEPEPGMAPSNAASTAQDGLFAGDLVGPYRLIRPLGQGGMSVVWLAERDDGQMRRQVALKMPHAGPGQAQLAERLRRERDILASLAHRHIARLYDVGVSPSGLPFLVLEYIDGQSLPAYCEGHQLGVNARLRLFLQVLSAVQHAHTRLVLHRDLKPGNILVNTEGEVKLLDFGIAKLILDAETGAAPSTELTQHHGHVLTPDYAAPEQIAGQPLATTSDVYALGVVLFELLTGQRPYRLPRGTRGALEDAILATEPRRPSAVWLDAEVQTHHPTAVTLSDLAAPFGSSPRRLHQQLRGDLDLIVATALQKDPARRYPTAEAFAQDLAHHLAHEPITAQPDSRWYRARKYAQRHAWALSAVGAVVLALSAGLGLALWQAQQARQEAAKANAIKDFLIGLFENGDVEQPDAQRKRQQTVAQLLATSAQALGSQLKGQPVVRAELQGVVGRLLHNLALTDAAIGLRQERVAQLAALGAPVGEQAQAWRDLADSQDARGDTAGAQRSLERGLALCAGAGMRPVAVCQGLRVARGYQLGIAGRFDEASLFIDPALALLRSQAPQTEQLAEALVAKADVLSGQNHFEASYRLYQESMALRARLWGVHSVRLAKERYQLAMGLAGQRRLSQAAEQMAQAWQAMVAALGSEHVNALVIELQWGRLEVLRTNGPQAREHVRHAAAGLSRLEANTDPRTRYEAEVGLGELVLYDGQLEAAEPHLRKALALATALRGRIPDNGAPEANLAWYLQDTGQYEEARRVLNAARDRLVASRGEFDPLTAYLDERLAGVALAEGRLDEAWRRYGALSTGQDWREDQYGSNKHSVSSGQAAVLMARGDFDAAAPVIEAQYQAMRQTPRTEQYRVTVYTVTELMARLRAGQGRCAEALPLFQQAIALMAVGDARNPYLAASRARYGACLLNLGRQGQAGEQLQLAEMALRAHPGLSAHLREPSQRLRARWPVPSASSAQIGIKM